MKAAILTIGTELLIGQVINTNAAFIGETLTKAGVTVTESVSVSDQPDDILDTIHRLIQKNDVVITSGGLGPTSDDITKSLFCRYFNTELIFSEETYKNIEAIFGRRSLTVSELNRLQAMVPAGSVVLRNSLGTAPGLVLEKEGHFLIALPGVPFEMKQMMVDGVMPFITQKYSLPEYHQIVFLVVGIPESHLAEKLSDFEKQLESHHAELAYLPAPTGIRLRITLRGQPKAEADLLFHQYQETLQTLIPEHLAASEDIPMSRIVGKMLLDKKQTLAVAESCTGGYIAHLVTSIPGSSAWFRGGIVAYSNDIKSEFLGVKEEDIRQYGAVSQSVAEQMATGAMTRLKSDYGIGITGIAGPDGGTAEKPVGTVWIAVATSEKVISKKHVFGDNRERNIIRASVMALDMLRKEILLNN